MCNETAGNSINDDKIRNENRFLIFVVEKNKNWKQTKYNCDGWGPCGFRPFDFDSKLKIENQKFTIVIFNVWFLKNWKSKIYNLNFQFWLLRKVKLNIILQYFENQKLKIENGQLVVLTFCFQFPLPKIQAIKNSNLTKQFMCNGVTAGWNPK